jgi:hypothetical protein
MAKTVFAQMNAMELGDAIDTILAARHQFSVMGAYASAGTAEPHLQEWADAYVDRLEADLRAACIAYIVLDIKDPDEVLTRALSICGAYNWIPNVRVLPNIRSVIHPLQEALHAEA